MMKFTNPLNSIKVASPCSANWGEMIGNDRQRFCGECEKNVFNLSAMTKQEAESLIMNTEGRLCARFYRRSDGTVMTQDCPVGWKAVKRRMSKVWTAVASVVITALSGIGVTAYLNGKNRTPDIVGTIVVENPNPIHHNPEFTMGKMKVVIPSEQPEMIMGDIAYPENGIKKQEMGRIAPSKFETVRQKVLNQ